MQHLEELRSKATEIATETQAGANTAGRIGNAFTSVVDTIDELVNSEENILQADVKQSEKITTLENSVSSLRDDLTSETSNRTQSISGLDSKLTTLQGKLTEETSARETAVSGVSSSIETLRNSISTEASTRENAVNTINIAITELKNKKVIAEDVTTTENGDTRELTLQAGKVYMLS